jgi:hypothetical protein
MKVAHCLILGALAMPVVFAGCKGNTSRNTMESPDAMRSTQSGVNQAAMVHDGQSEAQAAIAKLGGEDRQLAAAQGFCPRSGEPLGSMGVPVKVLLKGLPVFLCCEGCEDDAREHPDQMLAKVEQFKTKVKGSPVER